ncbi:MAG: aspartate aminotransferase family protein [Candidatus Helarchaeota archaeon]
MEFIEMENNHIPAIFPRRPIVLIKAQDEFVWDVEGKKYIDCAGGNGVALVGHCHPKVTKAIQKQASELLVCPTIYFNDKRALLAKKINDLTPKHLTRSFFSNSGTESVEAAIKLVRKYQGKDKNEIISMTGGFHGRTFGSLSATWKINYRRPFEPLVPGFKHAKFGDIDDVRSNINKKTGAIITEIIQGEGGVILPPPEFHKELRELCDEKDLLLIIDEVQTGFGRTGKLFAFQHYGIEPDILCLAKGVAGGIPIGITVSSDEIYSKLSQGDHFSTFGGNPLACAAALSVIDIVINEKLPEKSRQLGDYLLDELKENLSESKLIRDIRGKGLFVAIETRIRIKKFILEAIKRGILLLTSGISTIRMLPPLIIKKESLAIVINKLTDILNS